MLLGIFSSVFVTASASGGSVKDLTLYAVESSNKLTEKKWKVSNPNNFSVTFTWQLYGTDEKVTATAPSGCSYFVTGVTEGPSTICTITWFNNSKEKTATKESVNYVSITTSVYPQNYGTICPASTIVKYGTVVKFYAYPYPGYIFIRFEGENLDSCNSITATKNLNVTAIFGKGSCYYVHGLLGEYYDASNPSNINQSQRLARIDDAPCFNWEYDKTPSSNIELETFSAVWTGYIEVPKDGYYNFYTYSDDGVKLTIGSDKIIDRWGLIDLEFTASDQIYLKKLTKYPIKLEYQQIPLNSTIFLFWKNADGLMELVPESSFYVDKQVYDKYITPVYLNPVSGKGDGLKGQYYYGENGIDDGTAPTAVSLGIINFDWNLSSPVDGPDNRFSSKYSGYVEARFSEKYNLEFVVDDGIRVYIDGILMLDKWQPNSRNTYIIPVDMLCGQKYKIDIEYNNLGGGASLIMYWSSFAQDREILPQKYLYSN